MATMARDAQFSEGAEIIEQIKSIHNTQATAPMAASIKVSLPHAFRSLSLSLSIHIFCNHFVFYCSIFRPKTIDLMKSISLYTRHSPPAPFPLSTLDLLYWFSPHFSHPMIFNSNKYSSKLAFWFLANCKRQVDKFSHTTWISNRSNDTLAGGGGGERLVSVFCIVFVFLYALVFYKITSRFRINLFE